MAASSHADATRDAPTGAVHLVGSVPLTDNETVFREASSRLARHLRRVPDGETGIRTNWIQWQFPLLAAVPQFEPVEETQPAFGGARFGLKPGASIDDIDLPELGYREAAIESWEVFSRLKRDGLIDRNVRFQVCLPTPLAVTHLRIATDDQEAVETLYERRLLAELEDLANAIPADELAIQWDTAVEFSLLEGLLVSYIGDSEAAVIERLVRLGDHVPADVELGYHLCYGDVEHQHFIEPVDMGKLVSIGNGIASGVSRAVNWIHMPVPRDRSDDAYFAPLGGMQLQPSTTCYLGLVHLTDGVDGARRRIAAARRVRPDFGVATECGFGRRPAETIPALLDLHAAVADEL